MTSRGKGRFDVNLDSLVDGVRVTAEGLEQPPHTTVRRLSDHAYWVRNRGYLSTVVLGSSSALLLDPQSGGRGLQIRDCVRKVFGCDVSTVAYSHSHRDHGDDVRIMLQENPRLELVASEPCAQRLTRVAGLPPPTRVLPDGANLDFDSIPIEVRVVGGHAADLTWYRLVDEGVLHLPDMVHPGQIEFDSFGMAPDLLDYRRSLQQMADTNWRVLTAGHGQVGWREDVALVLDYLDDLFAVVSEEVQLCPAAASVRPGVHSYRWIDDRLSVVTSHALGRLAPRWDTAPGFSVAARSHIKRVFLKSFTSLDRGRGTGRRTLGQLRVAD